MKKIFTLLTLFISIGFMLPTNAQRITPANEKHSREYIKEHYTKREVMIKMRDGVELFTAVYEPKNTSVKHPVLMQRTCYSVAPYGEDKFANLHSSNYDPYVDSEYIFVFQDVRGKNMSDGKFEDIRAFNPNKTKKNKQTDEASDTYDTVEWIVKNTNNNGCVGQYGISYLGFYTTIASLSGHPALKAVSPQAPVTDWYMGDDVHHNGAFFLADMVGFEYWFEYMMTKDVQTGKKDVRDFKYPVINHTDLYTDMLKIGAVKNFTALYGDSLTYWKEIVKHPDYDQWWADHTVSNFLYNVKPAVMVVGGLFDAEDCHGAFKTYKSIKEKSPETDLYLVEGPWAHGAWSRGQKQFFGSVYFGDEITSEYYIHNIEYPFFAYYLEGKGEKPQQGARIFDSGSLKWTFYPEGWPLVKATETQPYYLHANGSLSAQKPVVTTGVVNYISDPAHPVPYVMAPGTSRTREYMLDDQRFACTRTDVLTFQTDVLSEDLQLAGEVEADLLVDISSTDADFVVKIIDVFPDDFRYAPEVYEDKGNKGAPALRGANRPLMAGYQMLVRGEVMRGKYRESFSEPKPFEPGKTTRVKFSLPDVAHTFKPGHRLMIQIQSSWFPLVDRNPQKFCNIYTCDDSDFQKATIGIHCEANAASAIMLPVVK